MLDPYLGGELSLTEVRVLYELAHRDQPTATELGRDLTLDTGYLSRILRRFEARGWLARTPSPADARQSLLKLTGAGHAAFAPLQQKSRDEAADLLATLPAPAREKLIAAMGTVQQLLEPPAKAATRTVVLRDPRPGDMGWVVMQHGEIYAREYGFTSEFEGLVAGIAARYIERVRPGMGEGVDRRDRRRARRLGVRRAALGHRGAAAPADPHAGGARPWPGRTADRRVHRLRPRQGLPQADAVDAEQPASPRGRSTSRADSGT